MFNGYVLTDEEFEKYYILSILITQAMWSDIYTLTTVNVMDIICTSLGGESHGTERRC